MIEEGPLNHLSNFIALLIFTGIFYFVFTWFREQVCIIACPYGRLQGVLLDNKSINVAYDFVRGEKETGRAKFNKNEDRTITGKGDCIDCHQCVNICPTGIDIRNGTQLECTNCTACIDECDTIMENVGLPKGLIRYASEDEIEKNEPFKFTTRMKGYTIVLGILITLFIGLLFLRNDIETTILRLPGQLFQHKGDKISNVYTYKIVNKTVKDYNNIHFELLSHPGTIKRVGNKDFKVIKQGLSEGTLFIEIYLCIAFAAIYLIRFQLLGGDNQEMELKKEMAQAKIDIEEYQKTAPDLMDEKTVVLLTDAPSLAEGKKIFTTNCVACHRADAGGSIGPNLTDDHWILGGGIKNVFHTITNGGRDGKGMVSWKTNGMKPKDIQKVASYVLSLQGSNPKDPKAPDGEVWVDETVKPTVGVKK
ncbi:unnamed protein product [Rotaria magnacalcarata]|uniref:Uncharacterized protein n=1 Tax=Rotaria magnacalcarata TaxID=392030 RepID=A0A816UKE2_9BILA|nr:unnamed protein product [Rotaria magnacalcarata]CAF4337827.1 unnamed protein product [Rotaria magnacalcarata]